MKVEYPRVFNVRKPAGFVPAVQRWSVQFPDACSAVHIGFFAAQAESMEVIDASGFGGWEAQALTGPLAPVSVDYSVFTDEAGVLNRVVTGYWTDSHAFNAWCLTQRQNGWWESEARKAGPCGFWREMLTVPVERLETLYWDDYPAALSKVLPIEPTPYCGYFGAMRDRIPLAACDPLSAVDGNAESMRKMLRTTKGARWFITAPQNLAMIRSASFWGNCDEEQKIDYDTKLRDPLARGMDFLRKNPEESGCCSLRFQQTVEPDTGLMPETHAHGYFLELSHMEKWSEHHPSHTAIFSAAIKRYGKYGATNQLRTWHEVYVLPGHSQHFEYINCHDRTGLVNYFDGVDL
jgi:aldoxime dehydratase